MSTEDKSYTDRLVKLSTSPLRKFLNVQAPYGWNIRRTVTAPTLDIGCGIGRNLAHLQGDAVGIDHNETSVAECRKNGFTAYTPGDFVTSVDAQTEYKTLLFSHVLEHMTPTEAGDLLDSYLPRLAGDGRVVIMCPQARGYRSDSTHVHFFDVAGLTNLVTQQGLRVSKSYSFPLPRWCGQWFTHNETVIVAVRQ